jgi:hypothetical protein
VFVFSASAITGEESLRKIDGSHSFLIPPLSIRRPAEGLLLSPLNLLLILFAN